MMNGIVSQAILFLYYLCVPNELLERLFFGDDSYKKSKINFRTLDLAGYSRENKLIFLSVQGTTHNTGEEDDLLIEALPVPILSLEYFRLIESALKKEPQSTTVISSLASLIVNRDRALFDNLPWDEWSIDPVTLEQRSNNPDVTSKYLMGKRLGYNRLMGGSGDRPYKNNDSTVKEESESLTIRILELELKEARMAVAEAEEALTIAKVVQVNNMYRNMEMNKNIDVAVDHLREMQGRLFRLENEVKNQKNTSFGSLISQFLSRKNVEINTKDATISHSSPYELLLQIIHDQLNADIIACVIENTSLIPGTIQLGGALVIVRRGRRKVLLVDGKKIIFEDSDDEFYSGVKKGDIQVIDCDVDEALGMALCSGLALSVEHSIWEDLHVSVSLQRAVSSTEQNSARIVKLLDKSFRFEMIQKNLSSRSGATSLLVDSLKKYDLLTNADKAILLQQYSVKLPRARRAVSRATDEEPRNLLDTLLLPFLDETVRRSYLIREAEIRGDAIQTDKLRREMSERQKIKELSEQALRAGNSQDAQLMENMVVTLGELRADPTQDEGSYSQDLDKDFCTGGVGRNSNASAEKTE